MNRAQLKTDAKLDISGRLFEAWKPLLILFAINLAFSVLLWFRGADNTIIYSVLTVIYTLVLIAYNLVYFSIDVGVRRYFLAFIDRRAAVSTSIFDDVKIPRRFFEEFKAGFVTTCLTALGLICLIIPGIYVALVLSQTNFVFAENPDMKWRQALRRSRELMRGHVFEMFCLGFSFFFWWLFVVITFGIGIIYVGPYVVCTFARYYRALSLIASGGAEAVDDRRDSSIVSEREENPFE